MKIPQPLKPALLTAIDTAMSVVPRAKPSVDRLRSCKFVSHRGERDVPGVRENTLAAFDRAIALGAWGIEFDIRWTADDVPIVFHDEDARRVWSSALRVNQATFADIRKLLPDVPSFEELLTHVPKTTHLMIEFKKDTSSWTPKRCDLVSSLLRERDPGTDFHLMSLYPEILLTMNFVPREALLPIAEINVARLSAIALKEKLGGLTGHYFMFGTDKVELHHSSAQKVGTGFISSRSVFYRELNRGIDWIFTNDVALMKAELDRALVEPFARA